LRSAKTGGSFFIKFAVTLVYVMRNHTIFYESSVRFGGLNVGHVHLER
jgi:hypothetical protein